MGFSISWAAVASAHSQDALAALGLSATGQPDEYFESPFAGGLLPTGWYVIVSNDVSFFDPMRLATLSAVGRVVSALADEHCMASMASVWLNGTEVWSAEHDGDRKDVRHLEFRGDVPESLLAIRDQTFRQQAESDAGEGGVDYCFDIPLVVAREIVGFKHDEGPAGGTEWPLVELVS